MKVVRAVEMGMCFGVRDALAAARSLPDPAAVTIHGELVHNPEVSAELAARGFHTRAESDRGGLPATPRVLITAHGVSERERLRLAVAGKELLDTTCPLVAFAHDAARKLAARNQLVVVIGRRGHVEVEGLVGDLPRHEVVSGPDEARRYDAATIGVVCQTTTPPAHAAAVLAAIRERNPQAAVEAIDTVCGPTRNRQLAAAALLAEVEAVVVVGGAHSNNTRELAALAAARGLPVVHVQAAADLDPAWVRRFAVIGLTAGTSTLDATIDAVERALVALAAAQPIAVG